MKHLSIEICQKLKEAGFPQNNKDVHLIWFTSGFSGNNVCGAPHFYNASKDKFICACPTLEELLDELPKMGLYQDIRIVTKPQFEDNWQANYSYIKQDEAIGGFREYALSPTEAAALLYIKLKEEKP